MVNVCAPDAVVRIVSNCVPTVVPFKRSVPAVAELLLMVRLFEVLENVIVPSWSWAGLPVLLMSTPTANPLGSVVSKAAVSPAKPLLRAPLLVVPGKFVEGFQLPAVSQSLAPRLFQV